MRYGVVFDGDVKTDFSPTGADDRHPEEAYQEEKEGFFRKVLKATKEVLLETNKNVYYVDTYMNSGSRYMGLILAENYCKKAYN